VDARLTSAEQRIRCLFEVISALSPAVAGHLVFPIAPEALDEIEPPYVGGQ
jgi:hypothetical protein